MTDMVTNSSPNDLLQQIALEYLKEKKRKRRWGIFYKTIFVLFILWVVWFFTDNSHDEDLQNKPHVALIDIRGVMDDDGMSKADNIAESLSLAYKDKGTKAIILRINSPGGSPVQADDIYREIMRHRQLHPKIKVYAVCTDMCASAAYYAASAADEIYANQGSIVGSIGVIYNGFGFTDLMKKVGVSRRLVTAGEYKGFMDPFSPEQPKEKQMLQNMLDIVHKQFEDRVKEGRGDRLHMTPDLFSGLFWTGSQAKKLGLIDGFGSAGSVAREVVKVKRIVDYTVSENNFDKFARQLGIGATSELVRFPQAKPLSSY
jgi:protease-4